MATSAERWAGGLVALFFAGASPAQNGSTFAYTGKDAVVDMLNTHHAHFGGISNSVLILKEEDFFWPYLPAFFFEYGYLVKPRNDAFNVSLDVSPEIFVAPLFMGRATATADLLLLAEADNKPGHGFGLRLGGGYTVIGSTFRFSEASPVARFGFVVDNIRVTYMYSMGADVIINHEIGVAIKFDW